MTSKFMAGLHWTHHCTFLSGFSIHFKVVFLDTRLLTIFVVTKTTIYHRESVLAPHHND
jgi:hypothetical protein